VRPIGPGVSGSGMLRPHKPPTEAPYEDWGVALPTSPGTAPAAIDDGVVRLSVDCSVCAEHVEVVGRNGRRRQARYDTGAQGVAFAGP
jgi:hypothetical protein